MRSLFFNSRITANVPKPMANAVQLVRPPRTAAAMSHTSLSGPLFSMEKPRSFGTWLISTVSAIPFM